MRYRGQFTSSAARQGDRLADAVRARLDSKILHLQVNPRPPGVVKLAGTDDLYWVRVGNYRIIYRVYDDVLLVLIVKIAHRRDAYR